MLNIQREAIADARRLSKATGNVGRRVTRLMSRLFNVGKFKAVFDVKATDILDAALFQSRMRDAVYRVKKTPAAAHFSIEVHADEHRRFAHVVIVPSAVPAGLRDRQALLRAFLEVIDPIVGAARIASDRREMDALRRNHLEKSMLEPERVIRELEEVVRGKVSNPAATVGYATLELAAALNPEIDRLLDNPTAFAPLAA
jgi:hypothetical protein